jgi:hypothetical protein
MILGQRSQLNAKRIQPTLSSSLHGFGPPAEHPRDPMIARQSPWPSIILSLSNSFRPMITIYHAKIDLREILILCAVYK